MITHLAGAAANCTASPWSQKWKCGWNQPATAAVPHAGYDVGHSIVPALAVLAVIILIARARKRKRGSSAAPAGTGGRR